MFNIINAMFFLVFLPKLIDAAIFLSPKEKKTKERYRLPDFDQRFIDSSIGALAKVQGEVIKMGEFIKINLHKILQCLFERDDDKLAEREAVEEHIDAMQKEILKYLTSISQGGVNETEAIEISEMMRITNNIERIGDSMENVTKIFERIYDQDMHLSEGAISNLNAISLEVESFLAHVINGIREKTPGFYQKAKEKENLIDKMREDMRQDHIERLMVKECSVDTGMLFIALLSNFEKMGDYCYNIAIAVDKIK